MGNRKWMAVALLGLVAVLVVVSFAGREEKIKAEAKGFAAGRQVEINKAEAQIKARDLVFAQERKRLTQERDAIKTQKEAVRVITKYLPQTAGQIVTLTPAELPAAIREKLPDAPGYTCMTEAAAVAAGKAVADLELCGKERNKFAGDLADKTTQYNAAVEQRDKFRTASEGGSKWQRAKSAGKWTAIGVAIGYVVAKTVK